MLTKEVVGSDKLRGGFYSPDLLVDLCLDRIRSLVGDQRSLRVLEPSAGDGAFIRGLRRHPLRERVDYVEAIEIMDAEAAKVAAELDSAGIPGDVYVGNTLEWQESERPPFDVAVGNPPYVRFQFVSAEDRQRSMAIASGLGVTAAAVSNLWISVFLLALSKLRTGGAFSMILPMEFMTGVAAGRVRNWLLAHTEDLTIDLFKPGAFPAVLQEVVVLSGRRRRPDQTAAGALVKFLDHNGGTRSWSHDVQLSSSTWTPYLLNRHQVGVLSGVRDLPEIAPLDSLARFTVSTVTGANGFFCVPTSTVREFGLEKWALPMLPRTRFAPGLRFERGEHETLARTDVAAWMLSFSADRPPVDPYAQMYIAQGESSALHKRFKCRIREPWYRVPVVRPGSLLMAKRSNRFPRMILNAAGVVTTDTVYRGEIRPGAVANADDLASSFHNSLTLLSAEIQGRSFGGGVLELVPSEIASLLVVNSSVPRQSLMELDRVARSGNAGDEIIAATDALLPSWVPGIGAAELEVVAEARRELARRRILRTHGTFYGK